MCIPDWTTVLDADDLTETCKRKVVANQNFAFANINWSIVKKISDTI